MPKHQNPSNIRMARLVSSGSSLAATTAASAGNINIRVDDHEAQPKPKLHLPLWAAALREELHADGKEPSKEDIARVYAEIVAVVPEYSKKVHSNYYSNKRRGRMNGRGTIAAEMENIPNPTILDLMGWKYNTGLSFEEVFRIVMAELSDVVKERAKTEYMLNTCRF